MTTRKIPELGCTGYITNPVNNVELMTKVRCYLGE